MDEVEQIPVEIVKKDQAIALVFDWLADEGHTFGLQMGISGVETVGLNRQMADTCVLVVGDGLGLFELIGGGNDLDNGAVGGFYEEVACLSNWSGNSIVVRMP